MILTILVKNQKQDIYMTFLLSNCLTTGQPFGWLCDRWWFFVIIFVLILVVLVDSRSTHFFSLSFFLFNWNEVVIVMLIFSLWFLHRLSYSNSVELRIAGSILDSIASKRFFFLSFFFFFFYRSILILIFPVDICFTYFTRKIILE